jgi:hypothetical protein
LNLILTLWYANKMARLEDILYLLFWNGYTEDCRQAVYASKETMTDERIWFPFLIQTTYGPNKKTLLQIMAEHSTPVKVLNIIKKDGVIVYKKPVESATKRKLVLKKGGVMVYKDESQLLSRICQFEQMAADTNHMNLFENVLGTPDTDGTTILIEASKNNCYKIVSYLLKRGADYNQQDDSGATPQYYAYNSTFGKQAWSCIMQLSMFKAEYKSPKLCKFKYEYNSPKISNMFQIGLEELYRSALDAERRRIVL